MRTEPADAVLAAFEQRNARVLGIGGAPGSGKSTIAREVAQRVPNTVHFSLDDFCWSKAERVKRGIRWRAMVGAHDLDLLDEVVDTILNDEPVAVPRYSAAIDDRIEPVTVTPPYDLVLIDGWLLGHDDDGYEAILAVLDLLVFVDVPFDIAKARRFGREAALREAGGGFSETDMQRFWDEVLAPGIERIIPAAKAKADVLVDSPG